MEGALEISSVVYLGVWGNIWVDWVTIYIQALRH
jgi:hypothetical protein